MRCGALRRPRRPAVAAAAIAVLGLAGCGSRAVIVHVEPTEASFDVPFSIDVRGLPAGRTVTVAFSGTAAGGVVWAGRLTRRADAHGRLDLPDEYLLARMRARGDAIGAFPTQIEVIVRAGGKTASTRATRHPLATASLVRTDERPGGAGFVGEWITPPHARRHTAILLFGGSEGGLTQGSLAETLAAHGYPVLHLAYFAEPGLPSALRRIPLEYFERALTWMAEQPQVDPQRIVTWGWSRGGEASLLLAATFPHLVHAAVGYVPSAYVFDAPAAPGVPAWTLHGRALEPGAIPIWRSSGPVFVVGGYDDRLWPSGSYVAQIAKELHDHGRRDVTALAYQGAGHMLFEAVPPQIDVSPVGYGQVQTNYGPLDLGGTPQADELALERSWPRLLRFLGSLARSR